MREFFDADEAAVELQRLTKLEWTAAQVLREAENGNLPICFQHQGKIGVFNRQESELSLSIFRKSLRTTYLPRGSYLRVQGHPMLTDVHQKQVSLSPRNLELAKLARGASEVSVTPSETLRIVSESGGFKDNAAMLLVPSTEWIFHADDLGKLISITHSEPLKSVTATRDTEIESPTAKVKPITKRRTWEDVALTYIVGVMKSGQYSTCKQLFIALEDKTGTNSPFDKGTGTNRGSLFVREISQSLSLKTLQNNWPKLLDLVKK